MSNRRRARGHRVDIKLMTDATLAICRAEGCTCDPIIQFPKHPVRGGTVNRPNVGHEDDCPLVDKGDSEFLGVVRLPPK